MENVAPNCFIFTRFNGHGKASWLSNFQAGWSTFRHSSDSPTLFSKSSEDVRFGIGKEKKKKEREKSFLSLAASMTLDSSFTVKRSIIGGAKHRIALDFCHFSRNGGSDVGTIYGV